MNLMNVTEKLFFFPPYLAGHVLCCFAPPGNFIALVWVAPGVLWCREHHIQTVLSQQLWSTVEIWISLPGQKARTTLNISDADAAEGPSFTDQLKIGINCRMW